jgi:hypothetical protein
MRKIGLNIAFGFIIFLMVLPALQMQLGLFNEKPLDGAFNLSEKPTFTKEKWYKGEFQGQVESYFKDHSGFRSFLVRLQNQVDFSLFRKANAEGAVVGKSKQLYEYDYVRSWLAIDYPGDSFVEKKLQRTKFVQEYLKREKNIDLVVVFEPGKASFYPEYLPSSYTRKKTGLSTYERYLQKAKETGIDFIDLQNYFMSLKEDSEYPLFPRYGTHWSVYGMQFAADSLLRFIERRVNNPLTDFPLTSVRVDSLITSAKPFDTDDDVLKTMNLLLPLKGETLAYPKLSFDTAHPGYKPMVLVVADSYYWNIFNSRTPKYVFKNEAFWYFNSLVYPDHYIKPTYTKDLDFRSEIEKQRVIFVMVTERFVHKFDWRFIDQIYSLYTPDYLKDPVYDKINDIMQVAPWYADVIKKADKKGLSLEDALIEDGKYLFLKDDTLGYMVNYGPEHFSNIISNDPKWMGYIRQKAKERQVSTEEMLMSDALYIFRQDFPGLYELNRSMEKIKDSIYSNPALLETIKDEADRFRFDHATYIRIKAWQIFRETEINKTVNAILSDPPWLKDVERKAKEKGVTLEEMARLDAEYLWEQRLK